MDPQSLRDRTHRFALDVGRFCDTLPKDTRTQEIATQLHDAAHSTAMNYRAACRGRSPNEFYSKLCITLEEADEAEGWLETLRQSGKAAGRELERLWDEALQLVKIFSASRRTWLENHRPPDPEQRTKRHRRRPRSR